MSERHGGSPAAFVIALLTGCATPDSGEAQRRPGTDSTSVVPSSITAISLQARPELTENSAAAASSAQPGIFFTINDSGNLPLLYAFDSTGADRGAWRIAGARNVDWEAAATGPCAAPNGRATSSPSSCVYIGEVGDNNARRPTRAIYKVAEPVAQRAGYVGALTPITLVYRYPDQPHDVEAMYVAPNGDTFLITKRQLRDAARQRRPALVFKLPASVWSARVPAVAMLVDSLPIVPGSAPKRQITDAAFSSDGRRLAVRTYREVYIFATDSTTGRVDGTVPPAVCDITALDRWQGEGVAWYGRSGRLLLTAEGRNSPMHSIQCPMP